jgi:hypothetical protein
LYVEADPSQPKVYDDLAEQKVQRRSKALGGQSSNARTNHPDAPPRRAPSALSQLSNTMADFEIDAVGGVDGGGDGADYDMPSETAANAPISGGLYATAFDSDDNDHEYVNNAASRAVPSAYSTLGVGSGVYASGAISRSNQKHSTYDGFDSDNEQEI